MLALGFRVVQSEWQDPVTVGSGTGLSGSKRFRTSGNLQPTSDAVFQSPRGLFESALDPQQLLSSTPDGAPYRTPTPARKDEEPACNTDVARRHAGERTQPPYRSLKPATPSARLIPI
jgi:hypothetical protein